MNEADQQARATALVVGSRSLARPGRLRRSDDGGGAGGKVTLSFLVDNSETRPSKTGQGLARPSTRRTRTSPSRSRRGRRAATATTSSRPGSSTGDMTDMFMYNSGSLFQALKPEQNLVPLDRRAVGRQPRRRLQADGVRRRQGLRRARSAASSAAASSTTRRSTRSSASGAEDVGRVHGQQRQDQGRRHRPGDPDLRGHLDLAAVRPRRLPQRRRRTSRTGPTKYTANQAKYADTPAALRASSTCRRSTTPGYLNKDFASAKTAGRHQDARHGKGAHYPMLTFAVGTIVAATYPDKLDDIGFFALPGDDACEERR